MNLIDRSKITLLRAYSYFQGPQSGELEWKGRRYWFRAVFDDDQDWDDYPNLTEIVDIPAYEWPRLDALNALYLAHVGSHWEYDRTTQRLNHSDQHMHGADMNAFYDSPLCKEFSGEPDGAVVGRFYLYPQARKCECEDAPPLRKC